MIVIAGLVAAATFVLDLFMPTGVAGGIPYVAVVLLGGFSRVRNGATLSAALATVLTVLGHWLSPEGGLPIWIEASNRALAVIVFWVTAVLIVRRNTAEEALRTLATTDSLTGAMTRGHFLELSEREFARSRRYHHPLSVVILDIDHFKRVNDRYGHAAGDAVLTALAENCRERLRTVDLFGRIGGEEFAVTMPETSLALAARAADRLRASLASIRIPVDGGSVALTVSIGVVGLYEGDADFDALLVRADKALYAAKEAGRDRIEVVGVEQGP
jgi:diguanylate cyclase (GGDEF)-like protein